MHKKALTVLGILLWWSSAYSQPCIPTSQCQFGDFISQVSLGDYVNTTGNSQCNGSTGNSYSEFQTNFTLSANHAYNLTVNAGNFLQYCAVWIDWNGDNDFLDNGEFLGFKPLSSVHVFQIQMPGVNSSTTLRIRVRSSGFWQQFNSACENYTRGETEDYLFTIAPNTNKPVANFNADATGSCSTVVFKDQSTFFPTAWNWNFGNGQTSTQRNPTVSYSQSGIYDVRLITSNANGSDTLFRTNYIYINGQKQPKINCQPATNNSPAVANTGIKSVVFAGIDYNSDDALAEGYQNLGCKRGIVMPQRDYSISVETFSGFEHQIQVWIDWNANGQFESTEKAIDVNNTFTVNSIINIPNSAPVDSLIAMRVIAAPALNGINGICSSVQNGQAEDYGLFIIQNLNAPVADFEVDNPVSCSRTVQFTNRTQNPVNQYVWDFGDGNTSFANSPAHTYANDGRYTVKLYAYGPFGNDTIVKADAVEVREYLNLAVSCKPTTLNHIGDYGISQFRLANISNSSANGMAGYEDFSCSHLIEVNAQRSYTLTVSAGTQNAQDVRAWLDMDSSGTFETSELIFSSNNKTFHQGTVDFGTYNLPIQTPMRLRVFADAVGNITSPCSNAQNGQVEDYSLIVPGKKPRAIFSADSNVTCGLSVKFNNQSLFATNYNWDFGDGKQSNAYEPIHTYMQAGEYDVRLIASTATFFDTLFLPNFIKVGNADCGLNRLLPNEKIRQIACSGQLVDDGLAGNYSANQISEYLIQPVDADAVSINFSSLNLSLGDELKIYNGPLAQGTPLATLTASSGIPAAIRASSGAVSLQFTSNETNEAAGFDLNWTCTQFNASPVSFFEVSETENCEGQFQFFDLSTRKPSSWYWEFGDGNSSTDQHPQHLYATPGRYSVKLITENNFGVDTLLQTDLVSAMPASCFVGLAEGSTAPNTFTIYPNPFENTFWISLPNEFGTLRIYNLLGNEIARFDVFDKANIDIPNLTNGVYIATFDNGKAIFTQKLIKQ